VDIADDVGLEVLRRHLLQLLVLIASFEHKVLATYQSDE
jgi:hypothetical protein